MKLSEALEKLNSFKNKLNTTGLDETEEKEFSALTTALEKLELPSNGRKASGSLYNAKPVTKEGRGPIFQDNSGNIMLLYKLCNF